MDPVQFKEAQRRIWTLGDYGSQARRIEAAATDLVGACRLQRGDRVLDIAAGNGNVAVDAVRCGAVVTAIDLTPAQVELGRRRTGDTVEWLEADAEELPFPDGSFDAAISCFGLICAPRPHVAVAEAFRVLRLGGRLGMTAWAAGSVVVRFSELVRRYLEIERDPDFSDWSDEATARALLARHAEQIDVWRGHLDWGAESVDAAIVEAEQTTGWLIAAKQALTSQRYQSLLAEMRAIYADVNEADNGGLRYRAEYLRIVARRPPT